MQKLKHSVSHPSQFSKRIPLYSLLTSALIGLNLIAFSSLTLSYPVQSREAASTKQAFSVHVKAFKEKPAPVDHSKPVKLIDTSALLPKPQALKFIKNWGLFNTTRKDSHINAPAAWSIQRGNKSIVVAVIDTGADPNHPDLKRNLWRDPNNPKAFGKDFVNNNGFPVDTHGHGTHVSGIIGSIVDQKTGMSGVAPNITVLPVKYYSPTAGGAGNLANTIKALNWAIDQEGVRIINYSGGGPEFCADEYKAIKRARDKGILIVAAAGNERSNIDHPSNAYFPASYGLDNILVVAATDIQNHLLPTSNYGLKKVHVAAPGDNIFSTISGGGYTLMTGTSQATAFVSGLSALILSENPNLNPQQVRAIISKTTDPISELKGKIASGGKINAYRALLASKNQLLKVGSHKPTSPYSLDRNLAGLIHELSEKSLMNNL